MRALIPAVLAIASLGAFCARETRPPAPSASATDVDIQLAPLSAALSEPPGYFDTDNLISNETSVPPGRRPARRRRPAGGVYIGVGPDQNFSYIARVRPRYAFILDIRRQNMLQHLLFAALFAQADDPYHYLCLLFSRPCPAAAPGAARSRGRAAGPGGGAAAPRPPSRPTCAPPTSTSRGPLDFPLGARDRDRHPRTSTAPSSTSRPRSASAPSAARAALPPDVSDAPGRAQPQRAVRELPRLARGLPLRARPLARPSASCPWSAASRGRTPCAPSAPGCASTA